MKLRNALLAATVLAAPVAAKADVVRGLYIGAGVGANFLQNETAKSIAIPALNANIGLNRFTGNRLNFDTGFIALGSIGYGFGNGLRVEAEGDYRQNKLNGFGVSRGSTFDNNFTRVPGTSSGGDEYKYGAFVNVLYDIPINFPLAPYVGLGVGYQHTKLQNFRIRSGNNFLFRDNGGSETDNFAYQAIVGAAYSLPVVPGLALTLEYRFMGLAGDRTYALQFFSPGVATRANVKVNDDYNHSILLGVRYAFNAAPPPPPPQPVPQPRAEVTRTYLVFFDWDRADLTTRARQIVAEAAQASTRVQTTRIEVNGYTDLSGTARYNQGLSVRRANAVAAELVRDGVPRNEIVARGFGESDPLVPTAEGVREPQNRRVQIILR